MFGLNQNEHILYSVFAVCVFIQGRLQGWRVVLKKEVKHMIPGGGQDCCLSCPIDSKNGA